MKNKTKIVISGSASLEKEMQKWFDYWKNNSFEVLDWAKPLGNFEKDFTDIHKNFYIALTKTEVHFIANEKKNGEAGYIGPGVFAEIAFSVGLNLTQNKNIKIILNQLPESKNVFYDDIKL